MKNGDMPASPCGESYKTQQYPGGDWIHNKKSALHSGLTKREMFAMAAMQGILSNPNDRYTYDQLAGHAVNYADALLAELEVNDAND